MKRSFSMRKHFTLALASTLATVLILATALIASANRYSIGDASGQLYVQSYTRFTSPSFALNTTGNQYSCQSGNHINESMWFFTKASHPVPLNGQAYGSWIEVGYIAGYDIGNPSQYGCDIGYYYADYPYGQYGPSTIYVPMGVNTTTNNYWLRFVSNQIGSQGHMQLLMAMSTHTLMIRLVAQIVSMWAWNFQWTIPMARAGMLLQLMIHRWITMT
jgi:hypothetical protein